MFQERDGVATYHQSELSSWNRCPHAFGIERSGAPRLQSSAAAYGSVVHEVLAWGERRRIEGAPLKQVVQACLERFVHFWNPANISAITDPVPPNGWLPRQSYGELRDRGIEAIQKFFDLIKFDDYEYLGLEYSFVVPIEGTWDEELNEPHMLAGSIDRLVLRRYSRKETVNVEDLKTGKEYPHLRQNLQFTAYCVSPGTPVLMGDLTWRAIGELAAGDEIMAVDEHVVPRESGAGRRHWRRTTVENVWGVEKDAWRLACSDGTELVVGAGHRVLAQREGAWAWRTVEDIADNLFNPRRKTPGIKIARVMRQPRLIDYDSADYMAGYVAGATLGDGSLRVKSPGKLPFWQISKGAGDGQLMERLTTFLATFGVGVHPFTRDPDGRGWQKHTCIGLRTSRADAVEQIAAMCGNPSETDEYAAGWLAGLYDTDGGLGTDDTISIYQKDQDVLDLVIKRAASLGFTFRLASERHVELVGDRLTRVEFTATVQPALDRKVELLDDRTVRVFDGVRITSVEFLGTQQLIDITTGTGTYIAQGFVNHNCYATTRPEFWTGHKGEDGFGHDRGMELFERTKDMPRRGTWINLRAFKMQDAGWRVEQDYERFKLAVTQIHALIKSEVFPLSISGENCAYCSYRQFCGGVGIVEDGTGGRR